jgi:hypothetical protein
MVFFCGGIVSFCGVDFVIEAANPEIFAVMFEPDFPITAAFIAAQADEPRGGLRFSLGFIALILRMGRDAQIGPSVIEGIEVSMVNEKAFGRVHNFPVQTKCPGFARADFSVANGIEFYSVSTDGPFETAEAIVIKRFDNRPQSFAQINFAKGITILQKTIHHQGPGAELVKPFGNL